MRYIRTRHLLAFRAVMTTGSVTMAAEQLKVTQPAISRSLNSLEEKLGFSLFERIGRYLSPTYEAKQFYKRIEGTLHGLNDIESVAEDIRQNRDNSSRISAIGPLAFSRLLPEVFRRLKSQYPDMRGSFEWRDRLDMEDWVASRQCDMGLTLLPVENSALQVEPLVTVAAVAIVPPKHPLADKAVLTARDFQDHFVIIPKRYTRLRQRIDASNNREALTANLETSTALISCHLVAAGMGVGISDPFSITGIDQTRVAVRRWEPEIQLTYGALWLKDRTPNSICQKVLTLFRELTDEMLEDLPLIKSSAPPGTTD